MITEVVAKGSASELQQILDGLAEWSEHSKMNINCQKNKRGGARATKQRLNDPALVIG